MYFGVLGMPRLKLCSARGTSCIQLLWEAVKKKVDEQLADVRKQLHENCNSFKSNNELLYYHNKTPPTPWAKGTTLIVGDSMLHEIVENRHSGANRIQLKSGFSEVPL